MARLARLAIAGCPHLLMQDDPARRVFETDADRRLYLDTLAACAADGSIAIHAWAVLDHGTLLLATPHQAADLGRYMQRVNRRFVPALNLGQGRSGPLWPQRYRAAPVDPEQGLLAAMLYVEQAPLRAGLVAAASEFPWSSAGHHAGGLRSPLASDHPTQWALGNTPFEREARHALELQRPLSAEQVAAITASLRSGRAIGPPAFAAWVAELSGRAAGPRARGRPRKPTA